MSLLLGTLLSFASAVHAAEPGLPFTEDFANTALQDPALTSADWNTDEEALLIARFKRRYGAFDAASGSDVGSAYDTRSVALADIDGDGDIDLMQGNLNHTNLLFLNNGGSDPFSGVTPIEVGSYTDTFSLALADIDGDGDIDLMEGNQGAANRLFLNNGTSDPFAGVVGIAVGSVQGTRSLVLADFDGDGDTDLMEGNYSQANRLFLNNGTPNPFSDVVGIEVGSTGLTLSLALADMDGDGDIDVMEGSGQGESNRLFLNNGTTNPFDGVSGIEIGSAMETWSLALADMDGDGDIDVVEGNVNQPNRLFLNNGTADPFNGVVRVYIAGAENTRALSLADIDGDGDIDMMEGNLSSSRANLLFLNNGTADPFSGVGSGIEVGSAQQTWSLALADIDGDGDIDVMEGNLNLASRLFLNNSTANPFSGVTGTEVDTALNTRSLALADIDGDGDIDVMEGNFINGNRLFLNNGTADPFGGIAGIYIGSALNSFSVALADIDGDGDIDLMEGNFNQANRLFLNNGTANPFNGASPIDVGTSQATRALVLADIDGDGDVDVMEGNGSGQANRLFLNNGTANPFNNVTPTAVGSAQETFSLALADIDGDGDVDLMEGNYSSQANRLFLNNGGADPFFGVTGTAVGSAQDTASLALADIDGDGDIDVMEGNTNQVNRLFLNNGAPDPFFGVTPIAVGSAQATNSLALADIDGDGDIDLMEGNSSTQQASRLFLNNGTADPFFAVTPFAIGSVQGANSLALADIDGDGDIDVMEGNGTNLANRLFLSKGGANPFNGVTPLAVGSAQDTRALALADMDGDGDIDVMEGNANQANRLFLNNGGTDPFSGVTGIEVGSVQNTWSLALADVDGDGDIDVVEGNFAQANRLFLNNGGAEPFFGVAPIAIGNAQNTYSLALADLDGDGDIDVMEGNFDQANRLFLNNGTTNPFSGNVNGIYVGTVQATRSLALADIDSDGDIDVMDGNDGQVNRLFLNNGGADPFFGVTPIAVGSAQNTFTLALADIDGDGDIDVMEGNYGGQANRLFLNSGGANPFNGVIPIAVGGGVQGTLSMALADVDGDGHLDVMEGNDGQDNRLFLNNGGANPFNGVTPIRVGSAQNTTSLALADIDGDGHIDVMEGNYNQANRLFVRRVFDTARNLAGSLTVDDEAGNLTQLFLIPDMVLGDPGANTSVNFYLSNNGGLQWFLVHARKAFTFPTNGSDLRWRAELRSLSPVSSPRISRLTITTNLTEYEVLFGDGFEDALF